MSVGGPLPVVAPPPGLLSKPRRLAFLAVAHLSLGLGFVGAFLPLLPTVPFLLLSAYLYARSSDPMHDWLVHHPRFGPILEEWWQHRAIPMSAKLLAVGTVWVSIGLSLWVVWDRIWLRLMLLAIGVGVSLFLLTRKTAPRGAYKRAKSSTVVES